MAAVRQDKTLSQLAAQFKVHPTAIAKRKARLLEQAANVFVDGRSKKKSDGLAVDELFQKNRSTRSRERLATVLLKYKSPKELD